MILADRIINNLKGPSTDSVTEAIDEVADLLLIFGSGTYVDEDAKHLLDTMLCWTTKYSGNPTPTVFVVNALHSAVHRPWLQELERLGLSSSLQSLHDYFTDNSWRPQQGRETAGPPDPNPDELPSVVEDSGNAGYPA